ncbi:hypothetical protein F2P79_024511, partial [Pimephales promelas]
TRLQRTDRPEKERILVASEDDVVLEEVTVLRDAPDLQSTLANLLGLLFVLDFEYPKELKDTLRRCSWRVRLIALLR